MITLKKRDFGVLADGSKACLYTLKNAGMSVSMTNFGCILTSLLLPSKTGKTEDILLGFSTLEGYAERNRPHLGSLIGRYANRIQNAAFTLDGKTCRLDANLGAHSLHGGFLGYDKLLWKAEMVSVGEGAGVRFTRISPDGEQGYPGNLDLEVLYLLNDNNELTLRYTGKTDAPTPVNLTQHAYFNLKGHKGGNVASHLAWVDSAKRLEVDADLVPTGKILGAAGTAFDFTREKSFGRDSGAVELAPTKGGYDACYCFDPPEPGAALPKRAVVREPESGRSVTLLTNQPCMQLYTSANLTALLGKNGTIYDQFGAFCLETGGYNNAPNIPEFPQSTLRPGEIYESVTVYRFNAD
ncbi:MAG: galactose mutarotase [Treponema sp.]|jgi:aldose 1-epimerase|nr:galactose mutarotase [Treponema sp.]